MSSPQFTHMGLLLQKRRRFVMNLMKIPVKMLYVHRRELTEMRRTRKKCNMREKFKLSLRCRYNLARGSVYLLMRPKCGFFSDLKTTGRILRFMFDESYRQLYVLDYYKDHAALITKEAAKLLECPLKEAKKLYYKYNSIGQRVNGAIGRIEKPDRFKCSK